MNSLLNRQRGIFGLGLLVSLAIYAGLAAAALTAVYAFDESRQNIGEQKARAELAPVVNVCDDFAKNLKPADCAAHIRTAVKDRDTAKAANVSLQADLGRLNLERQACNDEVQKLERKGQLADAARAARKPADDARLAAIAVERDDLVKVWSQAKPAMTCEQELAARDARLKKIAEQRARDFPGQVGPPTPAAGGLHVVDPPTLVPVSPSTKSEPATTARPRPVNPLRPK